MWQLKRLSTNEILEGPKKLPEDWGPIFGMRGVIDKLGDLSWLGPRYADMGWFETDIDPDPEPLEISEEDKVWEQAKRLLKDSDWTMLLDAPFNNAQRAEWRIYRAKLRKIRKQKGFPEKTVWPTPPS